MTKITLASFNLIPEDFVNEPMPKKLSVYSIVLLLALLFSCGEDSDTPVVEEPVAHVETLTGWVKGFEDGPLDQAKFYLPSAITLTPSGDLYVIDQYNHAIRKISSAGMVSTVFLDEKRSLMSITSDSDGTVYFANGIWIWRLIGNTYDTIAMGNGSNPDIYFNIMENGIAFHPDGFMYVTSGHGRIMKISLDGTVSKFCGAGTGYKDGPIEQAEFSGRDALFITKNGDFYLSDFDHSKIRKISSGIVSTVAGSDYGTADGPSATARFAHPGGLVVTPDGTVYVADNFSIRKISSGEVSTIAGGATHGHLDAIGRSAQFSSPASLALAPDGSIFVADATNHSIRKIVFKIE